MAQATSPDRLHGREARAPEEIPARGWKDILWRVKDQIKEDRLSIIAAGVAFYGLLAVFPGLIALAQLIAVMLTITGVIVMQMRSRSAPPAVRAAA